MDRLIEAARKLTLYSVRFGGVLILLAAVVVSIDVTARGVFNVSLGGADELSGFALAIGSAWAFSYALLERSHIRIDSLYSILPNRIRAGLDILGLTVFGLFMGLMAWQGTGVFIESVKNSTVTLSSMAWPLRYPQFLWVVGLWWFVVVALLLWIHAVLMVVRGNFLGVQLQIGSRTVREEIKDELQQLDERGEARIKKHDDV